ncbi:MAG: metal-sensitive transcriptional regulator [Candidatus Kerfeldbacteria bacterium]|nr:metal-sensitive transcriptional regulator [Candidatus Kerfeldbacteria bacterium]
MANACNPEDIKEQIGRTEGQVAGIRRMIETERDCSDILQQIVAARASLQKLGTMLLEAEAKGCIKSVGNSGDQVKNLEKIMSDLFKIT